MKKDEKLILSPEVIEECIGHNVDTESTPPEEPVVSDR